MILKLLVFCDSESWLGDLRREMCDDSIVSAGHHHFPFLIVWVFQGRKILPYSLQLPRS